jgi:glycosyltransferase involved in cell wall biosynthesis
MIANIVHSSLNPCGGSELLAIATMQTLLEMGIDIKLTTFEKPNLARIKRAYGEEAAATIERIRLVRPLQPIANLANASSKDYHHHDLTINTHGDMLPYFLPNMSKSNTITYCHFPLANYLIDSEDPEYRRSISNMSGNIISVSGDYYCSTDNSGINSETYFQSIKMIYNQMITNSTLLTNSEYSRNAILKTFGVDSIVLSPPVDVDTFRNRVLLSSSDSFNNSNMKNGIILVISRFNPSKKIENAIKLAKLLKQNKVGREMKIVGNVTNDYFGYYLYLRQMVKNYDLGNYVKFETDIPFDMMLALMRESKVYFHPLPGEPFGISTVEAMSAGLIPVVPDIGGHTEFVPSKYQFHTFGEAVEAIVSALSTPYSERMHMSNLIRKYSVQNYIERLHQIVKEMLSTDLEKDNKQKHTNSNDKIEQVIVPPTTVDPSTIIDSKKFIRK